MRTMSLIAAVVWLFAVVACCGQEKSQKPANTGVDEVRKIPHLEDEIALVELKANPEPLLPGRCSNHCE